MGITFTLDGFEDAIRRVMREELERNREGWLTAKEAAAYLGTSVSQVHNLVSDKRLPRHGMKGTGLRFRRSDLDLYAQSRGRGMASPPPLAQHVTTSKEAPHGLQSAGAVTTRRNP